MCVTAPTQPSNESGTRGFPIQFAVLRMPRVPTHSPYSLCRVKDRTVSPHYQRRIINAYAGNQQLMVLRDADHATPIDDGWP